MIARSDQLPSDRLPVHDRRATRRRAAGARARWLSARTRNAARHGLLIASTGALVMVAMLLLFVLVPRQVDRALTLALGRLPASRDTVALLADRLVADSARARAEAQRAAAQLAMTANASGLPNVQLTTDSTTHALQLLVERASQAPLVESYRALAASPALKSDGPTYRVITVLLDSLEQVHREREASAALSGPDARYAAMTARLTRLGQRMVRLAIISLAQRSTPLVTDSVPVVMGADTTDSTAVPLIGITALPDSLLEAAVHAADSALARVNRALDSARRYNEALTGQRDALRQRMQVTVPPVAMLLASLVLGVIGGFALALWRETRRPTVGDAEELESLTESRVIVHSNASSRANRRRALRGDLTSVPALSVEAESWPLLHLSLTHIGDVSRHVQVLAEQPVLAGAVALNLAAVAARESRATALVDAAARAGALIPLIPQAALQLSDQAHVKPDPYWDATRALPLSRDVAVDVVLPRRARHRADATSQASADKAERQSERDALLERLAAYDLAVFVTDQPTPPMLPDDVDIVLCARVGVTPLSWLSRAVRLAEARGRRVRAVLLWTHELPLAG